MIGLQLVIIIYLQGHHRVTVDELADRYDISTRTVYRDLRALQEAGVPIGSEEVVVQFDEEMVRYLADQKNIGAGSQKKKSMEGLK